MTELFRPQDTALRARLSPAPGPAASFGESFRAASREVAVNDLFISERLALGEAWDDYLDDIRGLTGERLPHPFRAVAAPAGALQARQAERHRITELQQRAAALKEKYPELRLRSEEDIFEAAKALRREAREARAEVARRETGIGTGGFLGAMGTFLIDPPVLMSLFAGAPFATSVLRGALIDAAIVTAVEVPIQARVQLSRARFGEETSLAEAATNVALVGAGGFVFSGALRSGVKSVRALIDASRARGRRRAIERDAEALLERKIELEETSPFVSEAPAARAEHARRIDESVEAAREGRAPDIADEPVGAVRPQSGQLTLRRASAEEMDIGRDNPQRFVYAIESSDGQVGFLDIEKIENGVAYIGDIVTPAGPGSLGRSAVRGLLTQLKELHPEIHTIAGERVSGARRGGRHGFAGSGEQISVRIAGQQPDDFDIEEEALAVIARSFRDFAANMAERARIAQATAEAEKRIVEVLGGLLDDDAALTAILKRLAKPPAPPRVPRLAGFLAKRGGLKESAGELAAMGITPRTRPGLINNKSGMPLDDAARLAEEEGFFPETLGERPTINQLLEALRDDVSGVSPRMRFDDAAAVEAARAEALAIEDMLSDLTEAGIDIAAPVSTTRARLAALVEAQPRAEPVFDPGATAGVDLARAEAARLEAAGASEDEIITALEREIEGAFENKMDELVTWEDESGNIVRVKARELFGEIEKDERALAEWLECVT